MQFVGKKGITIFVVVVSGASAAGFGSGLLVGRQFPAHHFERFGNSSYLLDPSTGKVCNPFKDPKSAGTVDLSDIWGSKSATPNPIDDAVKLGQPDYPPACGK